MNLHAPIIYSYSLNYTIASMQDNYVKQEWSILYQYKRSINTPRWRCSRGSNKKNPIVRREGRAMKHEGNRSTNRCIKGYRKSFVGSTWHITRGESLASSKEEEGDKRDMSLTGDNMI
jgi:hypothetical protein